MYQIIKIGDHDVPMRSSAATQYRFKAVFGTDLMSAIAKASNSPEARTDVTELLPMLGFIMARQAADEKEWGKLNEQAFLEWAEQFDAADMSDALLDIMAVYKKNTRTTSTPKNPEGAPSGR